MSWEGSNTVYSVRMIVYRICNRKHAGDLSGKGAAMFGGRWNKKGSPVIYAGESKEIALLEILVHAPRVLLPELDILTLAIPDSSITEIEKNELPNNWYDYPAPTILSEIAETWIQQGDSIALKVPSCIIHSAHNYILNCLHPAFEQVMVKEHTEFHFDPRLLG
ncbi:MAG: RES family NAD+ phosphorylase [Chlorobi bacterium]|nr:RES family NAD+ phosphorylase [Chlorobiota bacterium]